MKVLILVILAVYAVCGDENAFKQELKEIEHLLVDLEKKESPKHHYEGLMAGEHEKSVHEVLQTANRDHVPFLEKKATTNTEVTNVRIQTLEGQVAEISTKESALENTVSSLQSSVSSQISSISSQASSLQSSVDTLNSRVPKDICIVQTSGAAFCRIPFDYKGTTYHKCTTAGHNKPWCYTLSDDSVTGIAWGDCTRVIYCP